MQTVWLYTNVKSFKVFVTEEAAQAWFDKNDPKGVAYEYEVESTAGLIPPISRKTKGVASVYEFVSQRAAKDCVIASLATAIRSSYEDVAATLQVALRDGRTQDIKGLDPLQTLGALFRAGWSACPLISLEAANGMIATPPHLTSDEIKDVIKGHRAIIGDHDADVGQHSLAWDGEKAIDCTDGMIVDLSDVTILTAIVLTRC
jgi:hypothetical protein